MFKPLYPFTTEVLEASIQRGCMWFVRNTFWDAVTDHFDENNKGYFLFSHYNDGAKAEAHFNSIAQDPHRFLYSWNDPIHQERLKAAASYPKGYTIYSAYFLPDYKKKITKPLKEMINAYMYRHTNWKPGRGETVGIDFYLQFGMLYLDMKYGGEELKIKFADIQNK